MNPGCQACGSRQHETYCCDRFNHPDYHDIKEIDPALEEILAGEELIERKIRHQRVPHKFEENGLSVCDHCLAPRLFQIHEDDQIVMV